MNGKKKIFILFSIITFSLACFVLAISADKFLGNKSGCACDNLSSATGEFELGENQAYFNNLPVDPLLSALPLISSFDQKVLGEQTGEEKWIEVDLSDQTLRAWQGSQLFLETLISSGKWGRTPTGEFRIWSKFKYTKMSGGSKEAHTYYYLPNVPYTMYFHNGFGLHGTYWHNNFGTPMSHGCINMPTPMAEKLFYWSGPTLASNINSARATADNLGTRVVIHD